MQDQKRRWLQIFLFSCLFLTVTALSYAVQPVPFGQVTSVPGWRKDPFGSGRLLHHNGYDIAVPIGTPVNPTQAGTVSYASKHRGYGYLVAVDHGNGYVTLYGHLSRIMVNVGTPVTTETVIALSGNTGHSTGPHLHYEIRQWPGARSDQAPPKMDESTPPPVELGPSGDVVILSILAA
ncbi:M23 family metallopeptidase [Geobacter sp.]|uniref:M23 family metallopeptidase n=1 Tax=Geobacter sp. TaxID=46610 RepID=UPI00260D0678|nr:M23 family metallopeptidase [Geobacter sp.]